MDAITGAVAIVGLQQVGAPVAGLVKDFLGKILAPTGDALGNALAHPIVEWQRRRVERAAAVVQDAAAAVHAAGREPQPVPARLLLPILERASLEEDSDLRARWVALLANAAVNPTAVMPAFVTILGELSSAEARVLERVYDLQLEQGLIRTAVPGDVRRLNELDEEIAISRLKTHAAIESDFQFDLVIANLQRLALVALAVTPEKADLHALRLTRLGRALVAACRA